MNKGKRLSPGNTIGIVAPANFAAQEQTEQAIAILENLGYRIKRSPGTAGRWHSFAGTDAVRAADINAFFADPGIDAIICLRGGYGSLRILDKIDYETVRANPKIFMGYSDITLLHLMFNQHGNLVTFHGPMLASKIAGNFDSETKNSLEQAVSQGVQPFELKNPAGAELKSLHGGIAEGRLAGGNLITLVSAMGTPYEPDLHDIILFIEETGEATYRIDRALTQLILSGKLHRIKAVLIGDFNNCPPAAPEDMSLMNVFTDRLVPLGIPIIYNYRSGHCNPMMTLPLGAMARIDANAPKINIIESVVL